MTTHDLAVALAKQLEEEGVTDEELERIIHDAEEEARKEIARMKGNTMSDLIERDKVIEYCLKLIDVERKQGSDVMNYGQERINQTDTIIAFVENLPSEESSWASVLAELHERFDALENEIRKASAEMSAIIREYVDKGERGREDE